ncbi:hypothetical protein M406DRAFT_75832 [Cryphonectria parasitica EP155]|uniref:Uncharacterized protein n=1 Tax=Cryphonectria parasitica (strain ATCC 38755 / EP155) TaxID=660469 RepID=A0A9P4Y9P8_CRYP1|nr:uncharacterized protein M406DRAFT_75832 [Cryphonectria parasitica EP155]KAF3769351.1 hypothetical protein M406DRAFT_75832 [Cryphonectria parasitica EP155]
MSQSEKMGCVHSKDPAQDGPGNSIGAVSTLRGAQASGQQAEPVQHQVDPSLGAEFTATRGLVMKGMTVTDALFTVGSPMPRTQEAPRSTRSMTAMDSQVNNGASAAVGQFDYDGMARWAQVRGEARAKEHEALVKLLGGQPYQVHVSF